MRDVMQDSSEHKLYSIPLPTFSFTVIIRYYPTLPLNRTKGKCPNRCWIDFLLYSYWRRQL